MVGVPGGSCSVRQRNGTRRPDSGLEVGGGGDGMSAGSHSSKNEYDDQDGDLSRQPTDEEHVSQSASREF